MKNIVIAALLIAGLSACERADPPVQKLERAAEELVAGTDAEGLPQQAEGPYAPRDECTDQPGASEFLANLRSAVEARDSAAFAALAAEDIRLDFGGGGGKETLIQRLEADDGALWDEAAEILELGCASDGATLTMPWYFAQDIPVEPFAGAVVTGENVPLRNAPAADAPAIARISWDAVEVDPASSQDSEFAEVTWDAPGGEGEVEGHIERSNLRGIVDYRIGAARRNDRWRMTYFIAGD